MSDVKISSLPAAAALTNAEEIPAVQSGSTVKVTVQELLDLVPVAAPVPDSVATDVAELVIDYNSLLASLRTAGIIGS